MSWAPAAISEQLPPLRIPLTCVTTLHWLWHCAVLLSITDVCRRYLIVYADPFSAALPSPLPSALLPPHSGAFSSAGITTHDGNSNPSSMHLASHINLLTTLFPWLLGRFRKRPTGYPFLPGNFEIQRHQPRNAAESGGLVPWTHQSQESRGSFEKCKSNHL